MESGLIFNVQRYSLQDGPGIRTTVFLKGCPLRCWWCHNPEGQSPEAEVIVLDGRCVRCGECHKACPEDRGRVEGQERLGAGARCIRCGACVAACPTGARQMVGRRMTADEVLAEVLRDGVFYEESGGGVTFSGGEPLMQPTFLMALLAACRARGIRTAVDTSGYAPREDLLATAALADLVLYDLKTVDDARHRRYTGVSNETILDNLQALGRSHGNIWVRVPLVPGFNDGADELEALARFTAAIPGVRQLNLLPYHRTGAHKWAGLGKPPPPVAGPVSAEAIEAAAERLRKSGFNVLIGG